MGRRSRKRGGDGAATAPAPRRPAPPPARAERPRGTVAARPSRPGRERPRAPWRPFPLVELCVLIGLVLLVWGLVRGDGEGGRLMLVSGMALASLGGLDTALREHFSGFASHALLIAAVPAVLVAGVLFFAGVPWIAVPVAGALTLAAAFAALRRAFRRRG